MLLTAADSLSVSSGKNCETFIKHTHTHTERYTRTHTYKLDPILSCVCLSLTLVKNGVYEALIVFGLVLWRSSGARFGAASVSALEWRAPQ